MDQEYSAAGRAARYQYDKSGRIGEMELPDGKVVYTNEDANLRRGRKGPGYTIDDEHNSDGSLARRKLEPAQLEVKLPIDSAGRAAGVELNDLFVSYTYDTRGQLTELGLPRGYSIKVASDEAARPTEFTFGKVGSETITWDRADRVTALQAKDASGKSIFTERYSYDPAGNVSQRITDAAPPAKFEYDAELRLTAVSGGKTQQKFTYDVDGNLTTNGDGSARAQIDSLGRPTQQGTTGYSWDSAGNLSTVQSANAKISHTFDAAGRLLERRDAKGAWKFGYVDGPDRLWSESAAGKRWYSYLDDRLVGLKDESGVTWLVVSLPGTDRPIALSGSNGKTLFVLYDRIGSARRFIDASSGAVVARDDYAPFGKLEATNGNPPLRIFAGMVRDDSGLYYARERYYDPAIARFISIDPLIGTLGVPSSHNAYAYAANNPLRYRDPMGAGSSFEDEIANYHEMHDYEYLTDASGRPLTYQSGPMKGEPIPKTYQSGPFKGEAIVDKSSTPVAIRNNGYDMLTNGEKTATREAYEGAKAARQVIQNPASTADQVSAATAAAAQHEAELARLNEISKLRYGHALNLTGTEAGWGGANSNRMMTEYEKRMQELGADPLAHYSNAENRPVVQERATGIQTEADAAARDARAQGAFGRGGSTNQVAVKPNPNATGAVSAKGEGEGSDTLQVKPGEGKGTVQVKPGDGADKGTVQVKPKGTEGATEAGEKSASDLAASAREKLDRALKNNEAVNISKEEMAAFKAEEAAKNGSSLTKAGGEGTTAEGIAGGAGKAGEVAFDPKTGMWKPVSSGGVTAGEALEGAGQRWLGPKILETGGKILEVAHPVLQVMTAIDVARLGGAMANNYIDFLNQPFAKEQKDKQAAKWLAEDLIKRMAELAASDPNAIILGDGRKFDPNSPADMEEILRNLGQNLYFGRKPFDGIFKYIPKLDPNVLPKTYMGAAPDDTAKEFSLTSARKLLQEGYTAQQKAKDAATELARLEDEAKTQLQSAVTLSGARAVVESDYTKVLEKAGDVKAKAAALQGQTKAMEAADTELHGAISKCEEAAAKICDYANRVTGATEGEIATWRKEATNELMGASNLLNNAQAKVDGIDGSIQALSTAIAVLNGFKASLTIYQMGGAMAEKANISPEGPLNAAKAAAQNAEATRTKLTTAMGELRGIIGKVVTLVSPYTATEIEAVAIQAAANGLSAGLEEPGTFNFGTLLSLATPVVDAAIANQKAVEKTLGNLDIDSVVNSATEVLQSAQTAFSNASAIAAGPERYRPLQNASQCFALLKPASKTAEASPTPTPETSATPVVADDNVLVPDISGFEGVSEMKAAASSAGLVPSLAATKATPPPGTTRLFAGQDPAAGTKAKRGAPLQILIYQSSVAPSPSPTPYAAESPSPNESEEVRVPDLSAFSNVSEMKVALSHVGLTGAFSAKGKPPSKEQEFKFASQAPGADAKLKRGSTVSVSIYQKFEEETTSPTPTPASSSGTRTASGTMPSLIGLTLDQAMASLTSNMRIGSYEEGANPPTPQQALTIFSQSPLAGTRFDANKPLVISVKRYSAAQVNTAVRFDGTYTGSYTGADKGRVRFTVSGGSITISSPGSGSGTVSAGGSASISGAGNDGNSSYSFSGTFTIGADGRATASGRWSGQQSGFQGSGTWSASR